MTADARIDAGMSAQLARRRAELAAGAQPLGWKIGLNVELVQRRLGIDAPVVGYLTTATRLAPEAPAAVGGLARPLLEPEIAIHLGRDVPAGASPQAAAEAIAGLGPALELVDVDPSLELEAILAGNVFHRGVLLGPPRPGAGGDDLGVVVRAGDDEPLHARLSEDPADVVRFVSAFLAEHGASLSAGECIIAGSLTPPLPLRPGARVEAEFGPLGTLGLDIAG